MLTRTEALLALILLQGLNAASWETRVATLALAGLTKVEIADLLDMTAVDVGRAERFKRRKR